MWFAAMAIPRSLFNLGAVVKVPSYPISLNSFFNNIGKV
jgi:hypothetical protein